MTRKSRYEKARANKDGAQIQADETLTPFYTVADVAWITNIDGNDIRKLEEKKKFPKRIRSTVGRVRFRRSDVHQWMKEQGEKILKRFLKSLPSGIWWQKSGRMVFFHSPRGFTFYDGEHYDGHIDAYAVNNYRKLLTLHQCSDYPYCLECKVCSDDHMKKNGWFQL